MIAEIQNCIIKIFGYAMIVATYGILYMHVYGYLTVIAHVLKLVEDIVQLI